MSKDRHALVVDDIAQNRVVAQAMLQKLGWTVQTACDGREALERLNATQFDLVLLDISMPGMSGIEVCQSIRGSATLAELPVIAYTAHALPEDRQKFIASGFDEVIIKPASSETLASVISIVVRR